MTDLEALEYLYYKCKGYRKRWCPPFFSFCEFEIIFPGKVNSEATRQLEEAYLTFAKEFYISVEEKEVKDTDFKYLIRVNKKEKDHFLTRVNKIRQKFWYWDDVIIKRK